MLRPLIIGTAFVGITVGLLWLQPTSKSDRFVDTDAMADLPALDTEQDQDAVSRNAVSLTEEPLTIAPPAPAPQPVARLAATVETTEPLITLDNIRTVNITADNATPSVTIRGLEPLIASALSQGMNGAEIDILVKQAVQSGLLKVPAHMITPNGDADARAILATLTQQSAPVPKIERPLGNTYVVRPGDTLALIAQRYYGTTAALEDLYWANKDRLENPDALRVGQTLFLPQL